jgi:uroporphyrinogen-III decarboxylase
LAEKPRLGILEDAPRWWPDFKPPEFTEEDQSEIERYCRKIVENVGKEKITPWERWKTTTSLGIPDRPIIQMFADPCAVSRVLDCWSYSLKPGYDMYNYPKLFVKANLAWVAKFNYDMPCVYTLWAAISMVEWGGSSKAKLLPEMMPASIDPPIKTEADWDRIHVPDIHRDGLLPPSIWAMRKIKEFMKKYDLSKVIPLMGFTEVAPYPAVLILMGIKKGLAAIKREPEHVHHRAAELLLQFNIEYVKAMQEAGADVTVSAGELGVGGLERGKPFEKYFLELIRAVGPNHLFLDSVMGEPQLEHRCETGSIGTGWICTTDIPFDLQRRLATKYKKVFGVQAVNPPELTRKPSEVAENTKKAIKTCAGPGFFIVCNQDYYSKIENLDTYVKTAKEYGREVYKELK